MKKIYLKMLFAAVCLCTGSSAWGADWTTVWSADFSSAPSGMTYSVSNGSVDISTGVLFYHQGGGSGNRAINTAFTAAAFNVDTNWKMEFDWGASSSNQNPSNVDFATNTGTAFTITWSPYATTVDIKDAAQSSLTTTLPIDGYNKSTMTNLSHFVITGDVENGIYLTVTNGGTTYVDNMKVSSTFGYPASFSGSLGRAVSHMALDNINFQTPAVAGFVAAPTSILTGVNGTSRTFTLASLTDGASIKWSETAPAAAEDYSSWTTYNGSVTTTADPIYAVATDGTYFSEVSTIATGAGEAIILAAPTISVESMSFDGSNFYTPTLNATNDQSQVLLTPTAQMTATFNGVVVSLPYEVTENGTLSVTVTADGYTAATTDLAVYAKYRQTWASSDYSTLTADDVATVLGESWVQIEATGRWASWAADKEPYTYYQTGGGSGSSVTIEENLRFRNVMLLNLGYGISRNVSGSEALNFLNSSEGIIAGVKVYNGYGAAVNESNTRMVYRIDAGEGLASFGCNNGNLLVQAFYYSPVPVITVAATIGDMGYSTFASIYALDLDNLPEGLKAYYVADSDVTDGSISLTEATGVVAAGEGLLLKGAAGASYDIPVATVAGSAIEGNYLKGVTDADGEEIGGLSKYVLVNDDASGGVIFAMVFGSPATPVYATVPAGKAYLDLLEALVGSAKERLFISFGGEATAINGVEAARKTAEGAIYNVAGQRVNDGYKGIVIKNGKKVLNR